MSSDPQLRCLLCDLVLAEDGTKQPTETCKQCMRKVVAGQRQDAGDLQPLTPVGRPKPVDPVTVEIPLHPPTEDDIPVAAVVRKPTPADIPTIPPARRTTTDPASVPYAAQRSGPAFPDSPRPAPARPATPSPARRPQLPDPPRTASAPRPKVIRALGVLGCMGLLAAVAVVVLVYCIVVGLKMGTKKAELRPAVTQSVAV